MKAKGESQKSLAKLVFNTLLFIIASFDAVATQM